jgi:hypothetical protein
MPLTMENYSDSIKKYYKKLKKKTYLNKIKSYSSTTFVKLPSGSMCQFL